VALETVRSNLAFLAASGESAGDADAVLDRVTCTTEPAEALHGADWVFEALPEDPEVKTSFFAAVADDIPRESVLATTTSSISLDTVATAVPDDSRVVITHWLNPAFIVPLVEVAEADYTDGAAVEATVDLLEGVGKEPVVCADSPGFIGSRVQAAAMNEAVRVWEEGVASAEDIDTALRTGIGFRMAAIGLLEFVDIGGVDILYYVNEYLEEELGPRFSNPESVAGKMERGELGPKTGTGYYDYDDVDVGELQAEKHRLMLAIREALDEVTAEAEAESTDDA
jgi:3-hydroxybutyryl-CoA dehydrogenase